MKLIFLISLILFSIILSAQADPILATVNGEKILQSDFLKTYRQNKMFVSSNVITKQKTLNDMISKIVGVQRAKRNKLHRDPTVVEKIDDILYHAQISRDLEGDLKKIRVTDLDIKTYYNNNKEYRTAQILLRVKIDAGAEESNNILKVAREIYNKVKQSSDKFGEFANRYSQASNANTGGDMGFQPPTRYAPEYFAAIKGKEIGYITPPIKTQYGFHIVKILSIRPFKDINLGLYKKIVYDQKRDAILQGYFRNLRAGGKDHHQ